MATVRERKNPLMFFLQENERRRAPDYIPEGYETHMKTIWLTVEPETNGIQTNHSR